MLDRLSEAYIGERNILVFLIGFGYRWVEYSKKLVLDGFSCFPGYLLGSTKLVGNYVDPIKRCLHNGFSKRAEAILTTIQLRAQGFVLT